MNHGSLYLYVGWPRTSVVDGKPLEVAAMEREGQHRITFQIGLVIMGPAGRNRFHWAMRQGLQEPLAMANSEASIPDDSDAKLFCIF